MHHSLLADLLLLLLLLQQEAALLLAGEATLLQGLQLLQLLLLLRLQLLLDEAGRLRLLCKGLPQRAVLAAIRQGGAVATALSNPCLTKIADGAKVGPWQAWALRWAPAECEALLRLLGLRLLLFLLLLLLLLLQACKPPAALTQEPCREGGGAGSRCYIARPRRHQR